jgi:rhamnosyl/mannosyltransferase
MRILQVVKLYYPWIGGVEKVVQQIVEGLNGKDGFEIEVLCCAHEKKGKEEKINGVKIHRASSFGIFWGMPISFDFFRLFKKLSKKVDIIDFHHPFPLGDLGIFLFRPKARLIVHYHSDIVRQRIFNFFYKPLIFNTLKKAKKIIVSNPNLIESSSYLQKFKEKCEVISFGVNLEKFKKFDLEKVRKIKEKYGDFVLFVGRLNYYKGLHYLIDAMKGVKANLVIVGEGPEKSNLLSHISNLKLENKIFLLPFQPEEELVNYYRACSVFVLPSIFKSEAFGLVLIEAMACGKPMISTELGTGTSFVNRNGVTGFVVPPRDSGALAEAINKILSDKELAQKFGKNAENLVIEKFSLQKMIEKTKSVYKGVFSC